MTGRDAGGAAAAVLRWLLRCYPEDFRADVGPEWLSTYRERARVARSAGIGPTVSFWWSAVADSVRNGLGERARPAVAWRRRGDWGRDTQRAVRRLVRAPAFTLATAGTLAVGLGAFAVVWAVVDNVLLEAPAYERPQDLYWVWRDYSAFMDLDRGWLSGADVAALDTAGGPIEGAVATQVGRVAVATGEGGGPEELKAMYTGPGFFDLVGVAPALGRGFAPDEGGAGRPDLAVLGHDLWRTSFGADAAIVGRTLRIDGDPYVVIGVMPEGFRFARHSSLGGPETADLYLTFPYNVALRSPAGGSVAGLLRARPGEDPARVDAAVAAVGTGLDERLFGSRGVRYYAVGLLPDLVAPVRPALVVLALAGAFLVLVLGANLATLLLGRAAQRERELAVARALGAGRWPLARATLLEGALLGLLGAGGGLLLALRGTRALVARVPPDLPRRAAISVDGTVVAVVLGLGLLLGLAAAAIPAAWAARSRLGDVLRQASVRGGAGGGRLRRGMIVVQVALSLVLLSAGGVLVRSVQALLRTDPGFRATGALTFAVSLSGGAYADDGSVLDFQDRFLRSLRSIPGVTTAGGVSALPLSAAAQQITVGFAGAPGNTGQKDHDEPLVDVVRATEGAVPALGARLLAGRVPAFDAESGENEVMIDQTLAATFYPDGSALGATVVAGDETLRVVGVLQQPRLYDVHRDDRGQLWVRSRDAVARSLHYVIRSERRPASLVGDVRAALRATDPALPLSDVRPIGDLVSEALGRQRLSATLIAAFALGALALAAMGLSGIVSATVTRRRPELGIRMALGADAGRVLRMVVRDGLALVGLGLVVAVPGIWAAGRLLRGLLVDVSPFDPVTLAAVAAGLVAVASVACWIPARRVTAIDPSRSLRAE